MKDVRVPQLSEWEIIEGLSQANSSVRRRHPKILHQQGDEFNEVVNFIMQDSYMQPHLHPGDEKIEKIYIIQGKVAVLFFDEQGSVKKYVMLEKGGLEWVAVPAFAWHTYVMLSESAITYETMAGVYEPKTWKKYAEWAPLENSTDSLTYLNSLKEKAIKGSM